MTQSNKNMKDAKFMDYSTPIEERVDDLLQRLTLEEKISLLHTNNPGIPHLNIPDVRLANEALHGLVKPGKNTVFPMSIAFGATWDPNLIHQVGTAISDEARARHNNNPSDSCLAFWTPTINMARHPRWGRTAETYGEDPWLTSQIGVSFVKGLQGDDSKYLKVQASPKHFVGNNQDEIRHRCWANIDMKNLRNYYLPAFKACIQEGRAESIMAAYNALFGAPCCASQFLLTKILREEWGFPGYDGTGGYVVTDCSAFNDYLWPRYHITNHRYEAVGMSFNAGIDMECGDDVRRGHLLKAVNKGLVKMDVIDRATHNVLRTRFKLGLFDPKEMIPYNTIPMDVIGCKKHNDLALKVSEESIVLLKNDSPNESDNVSESPLLPLDSNSNMKFAILGKNAAIPQLGDYSGIPKNHPVSPLEGIKNKFKNASFQFVPWISQEGSKGYQIIPATYLRPSSDCKKFVGLKRDFYPQFGFSGNVTTAVDREIDFFWGQEEIDASISNSNTETDGGMMSLSENNQFSVIWSGYVCPPVSGQYSLRLKLKSASKDKKSKLIIDGIEQKLSCKYHFHANQEYKIEVQFPAGGLNSKISLEWKLPSNSYNKDFKREIEAAQQSDIVIAFAGLDRTYERESIDRPSIKLPEDQEQMLQKIYEVNKKIILILIAGSPLAITWEDDHFPAILMAWYPSERGGDAIANILSGDTNPSGKLPLTFYSSDEQCIPFDEYDISKGQTYMFLGESPLYPFGYGLSFSTFDYKDLKVEKSDDTIKISWTVQNTGEYDGAEISQIYVSYPHQGTWVPKQQLKSFIRTQIKSKEIQEINVEINVKNLELFNEIDDKFTIQSGTYEIRIGSSSEDIRLKTTISLEN